MSSLIQVKGAPEALRERLIASAEKNHRSLNQEALERLERSFEIEDAMVSTRDQKWIDEAMAGEFRTGSVRRLKQLAAKARKAVAA
jgi:Arc-like DNA binding domain